MALRIATAADSEPVDAILIAAVEALMVRIKSGEVIGLFAVLECEAHREPLLAGDVDPDGIAGFSARCLASVANEA